MMLRFYGIEGIPYDLNGSFICTHMNVAIFGRLHM